MKDKNILKEPKNYFKTIEIFTFIMITGLLLCFLNDLEFIVNLAASIFGGVVVAIIIGIFYMLIYEFYQMSKYRKRYIEINKDHPLYRFEYIDIPTKENPWIIVKCIGTYEKYIPDIIGYNLMNANGEYLFATWCVLIEKISSVWGSYKVTYKAQDNYGNFYYYDNILRDDFLEKINCGACNVTIPINFDSPKAWVLAPFKFQIVNYNNEYIKAKDPSNEDIIYVEIESLEPKSINFWGANNSKSILGRLPTKNYYKLNKKKYPELYKKHPAFVYDNYVCDDILNIIDEYFNKIEK